MKVPQRLQPLIEYGLDAEVDALHPLSTAAERVPGPLDYIDGVLLMELITDAAREEEEERLERGRDLVSD